MKKSSIFKALIAFLLLISSNAVMAQIHISPKAGLNFSSLKGTASNSDVEGRIGWHAGTDLRVGKSAVYFRPGAYFQSFTARLIDYNSSANFREETKINMLKVPMNVGLNLTKPGGILEVHVHGGLVPNVLLGVKEKPDFSFNKDALKSFSLGANAGVEVDVLFLTVNVQYEWGLTKFFEQDKGKNHVLSLGVGFNF